MDGEERYRFLIADIWEEAEFLMDLAAINAQLARQSGNYAAAGTLGLYLAQDIAQDYMLAGDCGVINSIRWFGCSANMRNLSTRRSASVFYARWNLVRM
jgi:hypothetical protein